MNYGLRRVLLFFIAAGVLILFANTFLSIFLSKETYIYFWDWSTFEVQYSLVTEGLKQAPLQTLVTIYTSLVLHQYSFLIALILAPWGLVLGVDRGAYLLGVLNVVGLPALFMVGVVFWKFIKKTGKQPLSFFFIPVVVGFLDPHFWKPILQGYYDVAVVIIMAAVWVCALNHKKNPEKRTVVLAGFLLALLALMRRWTPFWSISFFVALGAHWLLGIAFKKQPVWNVRAMMYCGIAALLSFFLIAPTVVAHMATTSYATLYSAYALGKTHLQLIGDALISYGLFGIGLALYGCIVALRDQRIRSYAFVFMAQTIVTLFFFTGVQRLDPHHHYPLALGFIFFESLALWSLVRVGGRRHFRLVVAAGMMVLVTLNFSQAFIAPVRAWVPKSVFFSNAHHDPLIRRDIPSLKALTAFVEKTIPRDSPIYVLASSEILNDDIIKYACRYGAIQTILCDRVLSTHHVDRRDGFPKQFFDAAAVITTSPTQYHLLSGDQKVIGVLARALHEQRAIGRAYTKADTTFTLDGGVVAEVYYKQRDPLPQELEELDALFHNEPSWCAATIFFQGVR